MNKRRIKLLLLLICGFILIGCNGKKNQYRKIVESWIGKEIVFPVLKAKHEGRDTICNELWNAKYKILHYVDTIGCTKCKLRLFDWRNYLKQLENDSSDVTCIFVLGIPDFKDFEQLQKENLFKWPVFYDPEMKLNELNQFPNESMLQTFLLNENNQVVAIGDPIKNSAVKKIYQDIINTPSK